MPKAQYFEVWPLCVPAGATARIQVRAPYEPGAFVRLGVGAVAAVRADGALPDGSWAAANTFAPVPFTLNEEILSFDFAFADEEEYCFHLRRRLGDGSWQTVLPVHVYALRPDLAALRPWKGDIHQHSCCSDGKEAPAYVAASARKHGCDFMALTDHRQYAPSLEAAAFVASLPLDLRCYPGEEVHTPDNTVHIINFGGSFSVNALCRADEAGYRQAVSAASAEWVGTLPPELAFQAAASEWAFAQIRRGGGLAMYCHPYWRPHDRTSVPGPLNDAILARRRFDILEVIGGFYRHQMEENALAVARYQQERAAGARMAVAGVSDAHGCDGDLFGWYYTIVFAPTPGFADLAAAFAAGLSVAVEAVPGEFPRLVGPFRLVKLAYFLLREYFARHDRCCRLEGEAALDHLAGDPRARGRLELLQGGVAALQARCWQEGRGGLA